MNIHSIYRTISPLFRRGRMRRFCGAIAPRDGEQILDVGGTVQFWATENGRPSAKVTLLNRDESVASEPGLKFISGDGCALPFGNGSFDIVFSNSVIEHVGTWERQQTFALEARRVGRRLWIQTPAREFFIEPHLIAPFVHWLPRGVQRRLIRNFTVRGWVERPGSREVEAFLDEVRLLTFGEMKALFPDCTILRERFFGLTKSYIAVRTAASSTP
jgi:hypothetical protein